MMKKIMAVFMMIVLLMTAAVPMTAHAEASVTFTIGSVTHKGAIEAGETITIPIMVRSTSPFCAIQLMLRYDPEKWEAVDGTESEFLTSNFAFFHMLNLSPINNETGEPILGKALVGGLAAEDTTAPTDTLIAQITLKALCTINTDEVITAEEMIATKAPRVELECTGIDGNIVIEREPIDKGDVNLDGTVSLPDATLLFYAVNGMATLTDEQQAQADLDGDGSVTLTDATQLFYYVNGLTA